MFVCFSHPRQYIHSGEVLAVTGPGVLEDVYNRQCDGQNKTAAEIPGPWCGQGQWM